MNLFETLGEALRPIETKELNAWEQMEKDNKELDELRKITGILSKQNIAKNPYYNSKNKKFYQHNESDILREQDEREI